MGLFQNLSDALLESFVRYQQDTTPQQKPRFGGKKAEPCTPCAARAKIEAARARYKKP